MTRSRKEIVDQIAKSAGVSRKQAALMLNSLVRMAYQEARNGFVIPGLCRIDVVERKARRGRNPRTGEPIEIPAKQVLRIRPVKKARDTVERTPKVTAQPEPPLPPPEPESQTVAPAREPILITFRCTGCQKEIEASTDMAGMATECPGCGVPIHVPSETALSEFAQIEEIEESPQEEQTSEEAKGDSWQKGSTIRIEVPDNYKLPKQVKRTIYIRRKK